MNQAKTYPRRELLRSAGHAGLVCAAGSSWLGDLARADETIADEQDAIAQRGKAKACIFLWLSGGVAQIDTWDPKRRGNPAKNIAGSAYDAIDTAISDVQVSQHLRRTAPLLDRGVLLRTLQHTIKKTHPAATNFLHTGRAPTGTTVYPSLGSVVSHQLGSRDDGVPNYLVLGLPYESRGPGFLGARHTYLYLTDTRIGIEGLSLPPDVTLVRQQRREQLLARLSSAYQERHRRDRHLSDYREVSESARKLVKSKFRSVLDLAAEPASVRAAYGSEFGQRCLLARRMVQAGTRFVEVSYNLNFKNGTGWDTHGIGQRKQSLLIDDLDTSLSALINDLEKTGLLDETLVVVATEFGRPGHFDSKGGRDHQAKAFSAALFGGSLQTAQAIGRTNELAESIVEQPISIPDFHATIYAALGIDPTETLMDDDRPVPITHHGRPVPGVLS